MLGCYTPKYVEKPKQRKEKAIVILDNVKENPLQNVEGVKSFIKHNPKPKEIITDNDDEQFYKYNK
uniref:Uncharacterized protein n=1 Tax=Rhizophora mucronata TaxID=61149 RepID=A0A2P2NG15_RHIMU